MNRKGLLVIVTLALAACTSSGPGASQPGDLAVLAADTTPPVVGTSITFGRIAATSFMVTWGAASDAGSSAAALQYKIVTAGKISDIDTLAEVDRITSGAGLVQAFTANVTERAITGLQSSTSYAFAVVVKDAAGNESLYPPAMVMTLDVSAPSVGNAIMFSNAGPTSVTVSWGAASDDLTPPMQLQYKLVAGASASDIDTLAEVDAITSGPGLVHAYTADLTNVQVTGLATSTSYAFAVVVKDAAGNEAIYTPASFATADITPPVVGTAIGFGGLGPNGLTVSWGAAVDGVTPAASLQYKLVIAASASDIDTLAKVDAITSGAGLVQDFASAFTSKTLTGLASSTSYAFAVVVKDASDNEALYAPSTAMTLDVSAPVPGTALSFSFVLSTGLTVNWGAATDDVTAQAQLEYKIVRASQGSQIDTLAEVDAVVSGPGLVQDWSAGITSIGVTGLTSSTSYAFAVVVRDAAHNEALYAPSLQMTLDVTAPSVGLGVAFLGISATGVTVTFGAATDDVTAQAQLEYKVVSAASASDIDTLAEVDAIVSGASLVQDWTPGAANVPVTGLLSATSYAFAVVVKDAAGNEALYTPATVLTLTLDVTAPTPGTAISFSGVSTSGLTVSWGAATDNVTAQSALSYKLVRGTTSAAVSTVLLANAITGSDLLMDWSTNTLTMAVTGLSAGDYHYYAVLVKDAAGNIGLYAALPRVAGKLVYATGAQSANLGGVAGADALCASQKNASAATDVTAKAMLAVGTTRRACTSASCTDPSQNIDWVFDASTTYYNIVGSAIGTTNAAGVFGFPLSAAMSPQSFFVYTGLGDDWTENGTNCAGFTDTSSTDYLIIGGGENTSDSAIYYASTLCSYSVSLVQIDVLCVEP